MADSRETRRSSGPVPSPSPPPRRHHSSSASTSNYSLGFTVGHPPGIPSPLAMPDFVPPGAAAAQAAAARRTHNRFVEKLDLGQLEYVDECDQNLVCRICQCPFVEPKALLCEHVFCKECLHRSFEAQVHRSSCPMCRKPVNPREEPLEVSQVVTRVLEDLLVKCPNYNLGCQWQSKRCEAQDHVDFHCSFGLVECSSRDCRQAVPRKDADKGCMHGNIDCPDCGNTVKHLELEMHQTNICAKRIVDCLHCNSKIVRRLVALHASEVCPHIVIGCRGKAFGCGFECQRMHMQDHEDHCPIAIMTPFMLSQQARQAELESSNKQLQRRNEMLEGQVMAMENVIYAEDNAPPSSLLAFDSMTPGAAAIQSISSSNPPGQRQSSTLGYNDVALEHIMAEHQSQRDELARLTALISDVDARSTLNLTNEVLRINADQARIDATLGRVQGQLNWIIQRRVEAVNQMRAATERAASERAETTSASRAGSTGESSASSSTGTGNVSPRHISSRHIPVRIRRLSDSTRQDTKL